MPVDDETLQQLLRLLEARPGARAELRRLLLGDGLDGALGELAQAHARTDAHLAALAARMEQLTARVDQLAEAQTRTEHQVANLAARMDQLTVRMDELTARVDQLTVRMDQLAARMDQLAARMDQLAEAQARTEKQLEQLAGRVGELVTWQAGEAGRRSGERYERQVRRRALTLFQGGSGGSPTEARVQERLEDVLADLVAGETVPERHDPMLSDLIWWKDDSYAVAEVALVVEWDDVYRVQQRAETLRRAGRDKGVLDVVPVVFGQAWSSPDVRADAERLGVAWWVGDDLAPRLLEYRRKRPSPR